MATVNKDNHWIDSASVIRKGEELDLLKLSVFLAQNLPGFKGELSVRQFPRGFSNLTYLLSAGNAELVLRTPPKGSTVKGAHDMGREFRILKALEGKYHKAPKAYAYSDDLSILGSPFYVMERKKGVILRARMPEQMIPLPDHMRGIAESFVESLVELHNLNYHDIGLANFGKPLGYVERQISGWTKRYLQAKTDEIAFIEKTANWLLDHLPQTRWDSLIHNDFKYDNIVLDNQDWTHVTAVLDWEMATIGDPLMDLGTTLGYWVNKNDPGWIKKLSLSPTALEGNPSRSELAEMYEKAVGLELGDLLYYYVFGLFKISVIVQQIYFRYKQGKTSDPRFASLIKAVDGLGAMSQQAIQKGRLDDLF